MTQPDTDQRPGTADDMSSVDPTPYVDVRIQAVDRLWRMSNKQAQYAWDQRLRDPLAPHALAMLFLQDDPKRRDRWLLSAASRMWLAGQEVRDLPRLLFGLHQEYAPRAAGPGFDIRAELADRCDDWMKPEAIYCGLAVLSLDTKQTWEQVQRIAEGVTDVAGSIRILLTDGTVIICERARARDFAGFDVRSTHALSYGSLHPTVEWTRTTVDQLWADTSHREVLRWMKELSDTLSQADNGRIVAARTASRPAEVRDGSRGHRA